MVQIFKYLFFFHIAISVQNLNLNMKAQPFFFFNDFLEYLEHSCKQGFKLEFTLQRVKDRLICLPDTIHWDSASWNSTSSTGRALPAREATLHVFSRWHVNKMFITTVPTGPFMTSSICSVGVTDLLQEHGKHSIMAPCILFRSMMI